MSGRDQELRRSTEARRRRQGGKVEAVKMDNKDIECRKSPPSPLARSNTLHANINRPGQFFFPRTTSSTQTAVGGRARGGWRGRGRCGRRRRRQRRVSAWPLFAAIRNTTIVLRP
ncbi:hypothetical protein E2C01_062533 [Portunus trituberculatus]|uniref:Uncharacterized protein n=1 Tax=Portunus trituberculatus TaxID=210409 RepID=A0A5B7HBD6_PORTR|nr:hypothetical protein [Portunus trituberculatus]